MIHLGYKMPSGNGFTRIQRRAAELGLDLTHMLGRSLMRGTGEGRDREKQRASVARWYRDNKQVYLDRNKARAEANTRFIRGLKDVECVDCGKKYPYFAMDFDHRDPTEKLFNIGAGKSKSRKQLLEEVAKCDVVCCLCHRFRTARRAGWAATSGQ